MYKAKDIKNALEDSLYLVFEELNLSEYEKEELKNKILTAFRAEMGAEEFDSQLEHEEMWQKAGEKLNQLQEIVRNGSYC